MMEKGPCGCGGQASGTRRPTALAAALHPRYAPLESRSTASLMTGLLISLGSG